MKKFLIAAVAVLGATGAHADAVPYSNWTGLYAGVNVGGVWQNSDQSLVVGPGTTLVNPVDRAAVGAAGTGGNDRTNFIGGGQIGYNRQAVGSVWVWGVEADFSGIANGRNARSATAPFPSTPALNFTVTTSSGYDWLLTARGRVGYAFDKSLVYVTGGLAVAELKASSAYVDGGVPPGVGASSSSVTKAGWTVGAGWEYAVAPSWTVKAEYLYLHFDGVGGNYPILAPGFTANLASYNSTFNDNHITRVGLNHKLTNY